MIPLLLRKFPRVFIPCLVLFGAAFAASPAHAMPCSLYEGDSRLQPMKEIQEGLTELFHHLPVGHRDYCQMAHLEYKLSRWLPEEREDRLNRCMDHTNRVLHHSPKAAAAYFLRGVCRGRLGEMQGLWASLGIIDPFRDDMHKALKLDASVGQGGPHRALGRLYYELPFFLGGDLEKSIEHLQSAVELGPDYWENHFYLGESYLSGGRVPEAQRELQTALRLAEDEDDEPDIVEHRRRIRELLSEVENRMD